MQRWEYKIIVLADLPDSVEPTVDKIADHWEQIMNDEGYEGWEAFHVDEARWVYLKRLCRFT